MSKGVAVKNLDSAGGKQKAGGQDWFLVEGQPVVVKGDPVEPHQDGPHKSNPVMVEGSDWFTIDGKPVCGTGDKASCGHATTGRDSFKII